MNKIARSIGALVCAIGLAGCAIPKKSQVSTTPSATTYSKQPPVVSIPPDSGPTSLPPPLELDLSEPELPAIVEENIEETLPSMVYINDRIFEYGRKLERWKELDGQSAKKQLKESEAAEMVSCFRSLQNVLNGYSELRSRLLQVERKATAEKISNAGIFELEKNDIAFLESSCGRLLADAADQSAGWTQRQEGADLPQLETLLDRYAENREYQEVAAVWQKIPGAQVGRVSLRTKINYANALKYLRQHEKAGEIFQQVVDQMTDSDTQATDLVSLRKVLADLYTASGNYQAAQTQYKKISQDYQNIGRLEEWSKLQMALLDRAKESGPELKDYSALLKNYLGFIAEKDGYKVLWQADQFLTKYPYSPVVANVEAIKEKVKIAADKWFDGYIAGADKLREEKKYKEALELLQNVPADLVGPEKQLMVKGKNEELQLTDAVEKESEKMARIQGLQSQWNNGMLLAKAEKYDEAIAVFSKLLNSEYSVKAGEKVKEMSLEAAKSERKKAADLFVRFSKTTDLESKKKLLIESHKLLKSILVKYPDVEIRAKVVGNIERVEQEMMAIDPRLVVTADQEPAPAAKIDGPDRVFAPPIKEETSPEQDPLLQSDLKPRPRQ
jgi:tetratricopeptide (TPR) repeat protein